MAEAATTLESDRDRLWNEICDLGLETYIADLDAHGYTVIPPEIASPDGLAERMLEACLDIAERRNGERPDLETGSTRCATFVATRASPCSLEEDVGISITRYFRCILVRCEPL